jgi:hypothetical protein
MRRNIAPTVAAHGVSHQLLAILALDKEASLLLPIKLGRRVQFDHVIASAIIAPALFFIDRGHSFF